MKNHYEEPVLEVIGFDCEDIITTSVTVGGGAGVPDTGEEWPWED